MELLKTDNHSRTSTPTHMKHFHPTVSRISDILAPINYNQCSCIGIRHATYSHTKLNTVSNIHIIEQPLVDKSRFSCPIEFYRKYQSLQNLMASNEQNSTEQRIPLSGYSQSSLATVHLQSNTHSLKQFYQSLSTHVIVCKYPVNLYIRYMNRFKIPSIDLIQIDDLWNHIGWGYLIAIAERNQELPHSFESIALILCQPITFKQLWKGYVLLPKKLGNSHISTPQPLNPEFLEHHVKQIHKDFIDTLNHSHCVVMELQNFSGKVQMKHKKLKFSSILKSLFMRRRQNVTKTSTNNQDNFRRKRSTSVNEVTSECCVCKVTSMESGTNWKIYQQSVEFFTELDGLISNAIAFRFKPESERQLEIKQYKAATLLQQNSVVQCGKSLSASSLLSMKNQISLPCLFKHVYSISREDLQTMRAVYGFQI
ncbi:unnamed protein product [Heterobilharzia americana]|nr:unnamed protein product [Heterobilharzia americana]